MADSQIGAPSNVTEEQPSPVQVAAVDTASKHGFGTFKLQREQSDSSTSSSARPAAAAVAAVVQLLPRTSSEHKVKHGTKYSVQPAGILLVSNISSKLLSMRHPAVTLHSCSTTVAR
jgi:hypothetical protein